MAPSYADKARSLPPSSQAAGPFAYSVDRTNSFGSNFISSRAQSITISEPNVEELRRSSHPHISSSKSSSSPRPSLEPRRQSIAQVLSRATSRTSNVSNDTARTSYFGSDVPPVPGYEDPVPVKAFKKRKKPKPRRRRSSQARDHGDFIISQGHTAGPRPPKPQLSPLITAISAGDRVQTERLIAEGSSLPDDPNNKPLQVAALNGHMDIVQLLLNAQNLDINARDSRERTAVYAATSRGHDAVVELLLKNNAKPLSGEETRIAKLELKRWRSYQPYLKSFDQSTTTVPRPIDEGAEFTVDPEEVSDDLAPSPLPTSNRSDTSDDNHLYKLNVGSLENIRDEEELANERRRNKQKKGDWVEAPMPTHHTTPHGSSLIVHRHARFPGFGFRAPIVEFDFAAEGGHRVINPVPTVDELLYGPKGVNTLSTRGSSGVDNICRWYHLPANHIGWTEDLIKRIYEKRTPDEQRKCEEILRREPFCHTEQDHADPTLLDPSPQSRSLRPLCRNMTLERDGIQRKSTALTLRIPYVHWETEDSRAEMHYIMERIREARKSDFDATDDAHKQIPDKNVIRDHPQWNKNEKLLCAYLYNNPPVHPRRTLDQFYYHMLENTEERDRDQVISRYYHNVWKRNNNVPEDDDEFDFAMPTKDDSHYEFSLPVAAAPTLEPTATFSEDRTWRSGSRRISQAPNIVGEQFENAEEKHVMMVDQLWLWILDENTIITSFPENWAKNDDSKNGDSKDVLMSIHQYLALVNRPPLESIHDLAQLIVFKSLATFCRNSTPYGPMKILDVYECAIAQVTDKETKIFNDFALKSKVKPGDGNPLSHTLDHPEQLYNIDEEIEQLKEIKDIQDELHILSVLLENQATVLESAAKILTPPDLPPSFSRSPTASPKAGNGKNTEIVPYSSEKHFQKLCDMIQEQEKRRKGLQEQAELANKALNHLLDLKQKQANVSEARSARWTAESTKQQGNIMVLFTLVTIIFAPLSLMVTIFSLRIVEFPDTLHVTYVLKYMFAVSVAVILPLIGLVVYTTRVAIAKLLSRIQSNFNVLKLVQKSRWRQQKQEWRTKWEGSSAGSGDSIIVVHDQPEPNPDVNRRRRFWFSRKDPDHSDAENGSVEIINGKE